MSKATRITFALAALVLGLMMGFSASSVQYRLGVIEQPIAVEVDGDFGQTVVTNVTGHVTFHEGVEPTVHLEQVGSGRTVVEDGQFLIHVTNFHLDAAGRTNQTTDSLMAGTTTADMLDVYYPYVVGNPEGSRVVAIEPESERSATIRVVDILPTVLLGEHGTSEAQDGLPGISIDDDGLPAVAAGGGSVSSFAQRELIEGGGEQVGSGDTVVINYMIIDTGGAIIESTWKDAKPTVLNVDDVFPGLNAGLIDSRVGSRLVLAVPARQAQGDSDVSLVVDVLAKLPAEQ